MRYAQLREKSYTPLYFLASLGAGGLAVSFFMYLMWMTPHKGQSIPSFSTLMTAFETGSLPMQTLIVASLAGIAVFSFLHLRLLFWNLSRYREWKATASYQSLRSGNAENQPITGCLYEV